MAQTSLLQVRIDTELKQKAKVWHGLTPGMKNPIHIGEGFRMFSKEELNEERVNRWVK